MNADEINGVHETYNRICKAIADAIQDNVMFVHESDRFLAHLIDEYHIDTFGVMANSVYGAARISSPSLTKGMTLYPLFAIPLDTLNSYL